MNFMKKIKDYSLTKKKKNTTRECYDKLVNDATIYIIVTSSLSNDT